MEEVVFPIKKLKNLKISSPPFPALPKNEREIIKEKTNIKIEAIQCFTLEVKRGYLKDSLFDLSNFCRDFFCFFDFLVIELRNTLDRSF